MHKSTLIFKYGVFCLLLIVRLLDSPDTTSAGEMKKPVFFLKYLYGQGFTDEDSTSDEDTDDLASSTQRHTTSLRIKEQFSKRLTTNLLFYFTRQEYLLEKGSYYYFYFLPDFTYALTDKFSLYTGLRIKKKYFDEPDSDGYVKDFVNLALKTKLIFKPVKRLTITPFIYGNLNLNENNMASAQYYDFGLSITSRWEYITLGGRYKGQVSSALGDASTVNTRLANEFAINLTWDPN